MNLNTEVWGTSDTWRQEQRLPASEGTGYNILKATKPRIATFATNDGTLAAGNTAGKTPINVSLDPTICPCGQDAAVSPFAKIRMFKNHNSAALNVVPEQTIINNNVCNWFLYEGVNGYYYSWNTNHYNESGGGFRWLPSANINNNLNSSIVPYVYWQTKSLLIDVTLYYITGYSSSGIPSYNTMRLADWAANPTRKVTDIYLQFKGIDSASLSGISYKTGTAANLSSGWGGIAYIGKLYNDVEHYAMYTQGTQLGMTVFGHCAGSSYASSAMFVMNSADMFDGAEIKAAYQQYNTQDGWSVWWEIPYSEANANKVLSIAALFGCPFTPYNKNSFSVDFTDNELYLPVIDDNGIAHGEYTHGAANATNPFNSKDSVRDYDYDPTTPSDPNTYSLTTGFNVVGDVASTTKQYVINGDGLKGLSGEMWSIMSDLIVNPEDVENLSNLSLDAFLTNNPIDAIVSVKKFPLDHVPHGETLGNVYLGKYRTSAGAYDLAAQQATYNFASIPIYPKFGKCFLDFAPYTTMQLYIPFCGTIDIDPADFMERNLSVEMNMDFITGTVTAYVLSDNLVIQTATGTCAIDIPITGTESATVDAAYQSAVINERQNRNNYYQAGIGMLKHPVKTLFSPLTTSLKMISKSQTWAQSEYELTHINTPLRQIGAASPLNSWALEFVCRLIIYYPDGEIITFNANNEPALIDDKVKAFGDVNGFATVETDNLSQFNGFTQVSSVDLGNVSATENELEMIRNLLQGGVYL